MDFDGKVAVVTGASRGIGKAIALELAGQGARVVVAARSEVEREKLPGTIQATEEEIRSAGGKAIAIRCDIRDPDQVESLAHQVREAFGPADILINNAAATFRASGLEVPLSRWDLVMDVNVRGTFLCTRAFVEPMMARGSGAILNISSGAGDMDVREHEGRLPSLAYGVSKAAVNRMTVGFAKELEPHGIDVNALMPASAVATEGTRAFYGKKIPENFVGPEAMVEASLHLVSERAPRFTAWVGTDEELKKLL
ncbi:SDR family NAD(P)-dependent oxidoreductase [Myxococcota bacterium]|nr:SDR family NAD(P)-dependent oxidoreductase [Myxococcota bacterium]